MTDQKLKDLLSSIPSADQAAMEKARERQAQLAKPPGSLGMLEELSIRLAGMTGKLHNHFEKKQLLVFAADNGVFEEGVSSAPQSVTLMQTVNIARGKTGAGVLSGYFGWDVTVVDMGVNADIREPKVVNKKIAYGTKNIAKGPAMTREEALKAVLTGAETAAECGADIIGVGEMGIGNTTTSSAVLALLLKAHAGDVSGRGGGLTDESFEKKKRVIDRAVSLYRGDPDDVIGILSQVGGFDLAAMCGAFLGAASSRIPVVIDGFISVVAALCAVRLCPKVKDFLIAGHESAEPGYLMAAEALGARPFLRLGMRLGEGSGCPIAFQIIDAACAVINNMATFDEAGIDDGYLDEIRGLENNG